MNARMTSEFPRRVRTIVVISRRVETNLIVKLNEPFSVVGNNVVFKIPAEVELAILSIKGFVDSPTCS